MNCWTGPVDRADDNPWPQWPRIFRVDYGHEEAEAKFGKDPREYCILSEEFLDDGKGNVRGIKAVNVKWSKVNAACRWKRLQAPSMSSKPTWYCWPWASSARTTTIESVGLKTDARSNYQAEYGKYETSIPGLFAAGDCRRGQSLVVWAISEGRGAARAIDIYLQGSSTLPAPDVTMGTAAAVPV